MTADKKKVIAVLAVIALGGGILLLRPNLSGTSKAAESLSNRSSLSFAGDPNFAGKSTDNVSTRELFLKMTFAVLLVGALGTAAIYTSKKLLPRITNSPGKKIRIVETVYLGSRRAVHLLEIGSKRILIASTNESITKLADVTDALVEADLSMTANQ